MHHNHMLHLGNLQAPPHHPTMEGSEAHGDLPGRSSPIVIPRSPLVLAAEASYLEVEGPEWEAGEETLCRLKKYESRDRNVPISMLSQ